MKRRIITLLLAALALALSTCHPAYAQRRAHAPQSVTWQRDVEPAVRLGVRDKFGALGDYEATFTVTAPDGHKFYKTVRVVGNDNGDAVFPRDFPGAESSDHIGAGRYTYECVVSGATIFRGAFAFQSSLNFDATIRQKARRKR